MKANDEADVRRHHHRGDSHRRGHFLPDNSLSNLFYRCAHLLFHQVGSAHNGQRRALQLLAEQGQLSQKAMQEQLNIQSGSVSELISKLEAKGFVQRQRDERDRRKVLLMLTEAGQKRAKPLAPAEKQEHLFDVLTAEEQQTLRTLLEKLEKSWSHWD